MRCAIRADASYSIGSGHIMRCLTLALALKQLDIQVHFLCIPHAGHLFNKIQDAGFKVISLAIDSTLQLDQTQRWLTAHSIDWLIVDHYGIDATWESKMRPLVKHLLVIDDLANRRHDCDVLLDQNYGRMPYDYQQLLTASTTTLLLGTHYTLLRNEFSQWRATSLSRRHNPVLQRILINFGGSDPDNWTEETIVLLKKHQTLPSECEIIIILGSQYQHQNTLLPIIKALPYSTCIMQDITNMAEIISTCDLFIGAAGSTIWECACLGLPCLLAAIAPNQQTNLSILQSSGLSKVIDSRKFEKSLIKELNMILSNPTTELALFSQKFSELCDGHGVNRVIHVMIQIHSGR